jgi:hypothetical protein
MAHTDPTRIRTTISVDREVHDIFVRMAETAGMSVSRCMGEWLADTADGAMFVAQKMAAARRAPMQVMREMQSMALGLQDSVDESILELRERARKEARSAPGAQVQAASARSKAPSSNTGLKETTKLQKRKKIA